MVNALKKRVLLINSNTERAPYPVAPLGLCMLATVLENRYEVRVYDGVFDEGSRLVEEVKEFRPDFIGVGIRNVDDVVAGRTVFYIDDVLNRFILPVRSVSAAPLILGGSGFSIFPIELMEITKADFGVVGEGEQVFPLLLERIEHGEPIHDLTNVIVAGDREVGRGSSGLVLPMEQSRFPEIDRRIDFAPYRAKGSYSIQTKRGCSHGCVYCTYPVIEGRQFRLRNPADIADEIAQAADRLGDVTFEFVDSTFNDPAGHAESICREIIRRKLKVRLRTMGMNPRNCSETLFDLMVRAGFAQIDATPDTASPRVLARMKKGFSLGEVQRMATLIRTFDLPTMWFFLFGGPGEDDSSFDETVRFIAGYVNPQDLVYMAGGLRIYPSTPLYRIALAEGVISKGQSILKPPAFYFSKALGRERLEERIRAVSESLYNCIPANETAPSPAMIGEALALRARENLTEPLFRTLLRIRKLKWEERLSGD